MQDYKMYILVNQDIKISKGKLGGQIGHAVAVLFWNLMHWTLDNGKIDDELHTYMTTAQKKIILYAPEATLLELETKGYIAIRDKGLTELEPNTLTCVNIGLIDYNNFPEEFEWVKELKLCH